MPATTHTNTPTLVLVLTLVLTLVLVRLLYSRPAVALIRKLIAVLESIERLPLHLYDTPGSLYNLQVRGVGGARRASVL